MPRTPSPERTAVDADPVATAAPARRRSELQAVAIDETSLLKKAVNTLAIIPKSARITTLGRKSYNVLLYQAQEQGLEKEVFRAPLDAVVKGLDFDSHDLALIKKHLRAMVSTTVEWQSPTTGEGSNWNVSGLLAHARLSKERGQVWVEWSYAVNLKQELLEPTVFARLRLEVISQLRSHAGVALYEICTRYKDIGRTARQAWRWWYPVLSGNPPSEKSERLEYRIFKRDTLKPAIAEVNAITDIDVELVEHKEGRFISEIQFRIAPKRQASLGLGVNRPPQPVDMALIARARQLGVGDEAAEAMAAAHGDDAFRAGLDSLERRLASTFPGPLRDPTRYLRALMPAEASRAQTRAAEQEAAGQPAALEAAAREQQDKRSARWLAEWTRRRHEQCAADIEALSPERQQELVQALQQALSERQAHPSITKRLAASGWQHPMVRHEMLRYFGTATYGEGWDKPRAEDLLAIAIEMGEEREARR
jgi:hypothetical protein